MATQTGLFENSDQYAVAELDVLRELTSISESKKRKTIAGAVVIENSSVSLSNDLNDDDEGDSSSGVSLACKFEAENE